MPPRPFPAWSALDAAFAAALQNASGRSNPLEGSSLLAALFKVEEWMRWRDEAACIVAPDELVRAGRRRRARDSDALLLAYALHRLLLSALMRCEPELVPIHRDGKGCPRVSGDVLYTSLSHADRHIAIAICRKGPVGIDIEPVSNAGQLTDIIDRVAHVRERRRILELVPALRDRALLDLWVRKESVLKAAGTGLECGMETFEAPLDEPLALPAGSHAGSRVLVSMIDADPEWSMAVTRPVGIDVHFMRVVGKRPDSGAYVLNDA